MAKPPGSVPDTARTVPSFLAAALVVATMVVTALAAAPAVKADWRGTGVVLAILPPPSSLHATRPVIVIEHGPIPGLMNDAMSMPFIAASTDLFHDLKVGDRVSFALKETSDALLVIEIKRLDPAKAR